MFANFIVRPRISDLIVQHVSIELVSNAFGKWPAPTVLRDLMFFVTPSSYYLKSGHDDFLPHPFPFVIHCHTIIRRCTLSDTDKVRELRMRNSAPWRDCVQYKLVLLYVLNSVWLASFALWQFRTNCQEVRNSNYDDLAIGHSYITMNRQQLWWWQCHLQTKNVEIWRCEVW
jgi:hypothetical protein